MLSLAMNDQDLATMMARLQVPLIVGDILDDNGALTDDVVMGLHETLSEDQPDSALLSIALSARIIAARFSALGPSFKVLGIEADKIIRDYGPLWLKNARKSRMDDALVFETLAHIPEDLESLSELLTLAKAKLLGRDKNAAQLCEIMITQSGAQALIAETFLDCLDQGAQDPWDIQDGFSDLYQGENIGLAALASEQAFTGQNFYTDNVVAFPGR
ncbi:MAG: hypothetical protein ACPGRX_09470 [Bdellovibrionales bacterium]